MRAHSKRIFSVHIVYGQSRMDDNESGSRWTKERRASGKRNDGEVPGQRVLFPFLAKDSYDHTCIFKDPLFSSSLKEDL